MKSTAKHLSHLICLLVVLLIGFSNVAGLTAQDSSSQEGDKAAAQDPDIGKSAPSSEKGDPSQPKEQDGEKAKDAEGKDIAGSSGNVWSEYNGETDYASGDYWFPTGASTFAKEIDWLFYFIFWVCVFFFLVIIGVMVGFVVAYRKRPGHEKPLPSPSHNTQLEILWTVLPSFLLVFMFVAGTSGYFKQRIADEDAYQIYVEASQFNWQFTTERGDVTENLHLVVNQPFRLQMESRDVLHSLFVPAFRQKADVVPGRYTEFIVTPTKPGKYRLYCTEYCGNDHSNMKKNVIVHETWEEFNAATIWKDDENPPVENGKRYFNLNCAGCHSIDGSVKTGPSFKGLWGREEEMIDGQKVLVDENYVRSSIEYPQMHVVKGYGPRSQMASFKGKLDPKQINFIIEYMKTLSDE